MSDSAFAFPIPLEYYETMQCIIYVVKNVNHEQGIQYIIQIVPVGITLGPITRPSGMRISYMKNAEVGQISHLFSTCRNLPSQGVGYYGPTPILWVSRLDV